MKILKVYDKINRNLVHYEPLTGNLIIKEYLDENIINTIINTKIFKLKDDRRSYYSYMLTSNGITIESIDITRKYLVYKKFNNEGLIIHSERIHLKDNKSFLISDMIYDEEKECIEIENHKGNKTIKFKIKNEIINKLLNKK
jgi:hypothetical protein